jgi:hypothetical protein
MESPFDFFGVAGWSSDSTPKAAKLVSDGFDCVKVFESEEQAQHFASTLNRNYPESANFRVFGLSIELHEVLQCDHAWIENVYYVDRNTRRVWLACLKCPATKEVPMPPNGTDLAPQSPSGGNG